MNEIADFQFEAHPVRIVTGDDGQPLWVAKDVLGALGYTWGGDRISHVPEEWRGVRSVRTPSGTQEMAILTEQGLYFFLGRSDKPAALPFQKWIAGEVLPQIRRTGIYAAKAPSDPLRDYIKSRLRIRDAETLDARAEAVLSGVGLLVEQKAASVGHKKERTESAVESSLRAWAANAPKATATAEALKSLGLENNRRNQVFAGKALASAGYVRRRECSNSARTYVYEKRG